MAADVKIFALPSAGSSGARTGNKGRAFRHYYCRVERVQGLAVVVAINRGTLYRPNYDNPYYGGSHNGSPNFWNPPYRDFSLDVLLTPSSLPWDRVRAAARMRCSSEELFLVIVVIMVITVTMVTPVRIVIRENIFCSGLQDLGRRL